MTLRYLVKVSAGVRGEMLEQTAFIGRASIQAVRRYHREYQKVLRRLEENPFQFPVDLSIDLPDRTYRKALFAKWFKVIFQVKGDRVYVDHVIDCRRDPDEMES